MSRTNILTIPGSDRVIHIYIDYYDYFLHFSIRYLKTPKNDDLISINKSSLLYMPKFMKKFASEGIASNDKHQIGIFSKETDANARENFQKKLYESI